MREAFLGNTTPRGRGVGGGMWGMQPLRLPMNTAPRMSGLLYLLEEPRQSRQPETDAREPDAQYQAHHLQGDERIHGSEHVLHGHARRNRALHVEQRRAERRGPGTGLQ